MAECQSRGVQCLSRSGQFDVVRFPALDAGNPSAPASPVDRIPDHRMSHVLQMHPDLVGPPSVQLQAKEIDNAKPRDYKCIGPGRASGSDDRHALSILRMSRHRGIDLKRAGIQVAPGKRSVSAPHPASSDRSSQAPVGQIGLRHHHQPRGIPVQPVDDAGPALCPSGQCRAPGDQCIDQGVVPVSRRGMYHQAGGLVDDCEVLVFEDDGQWNCARPQGARRFIARKANNDGVAAGEKSGDPGGLALNTYEFIGDESGSVGTGQPQLVS